jgi:hypothetical protein
LGKGQGQKECAALVDKLEVKYKHLEATKEFRNFFNAFDSGHY